MLSGIIMSRENQDELLSARRQTSRRKKFTIGFVLCIN
jgi:hypothetical protein